MRISLENAKKLRAKKYPSEMTSSNTCELPPIQYQLKNKLRVIFQSNGFSYYQKMKKGIS